MKEHNIKILTQIDFSTITNFLMANKGHILQSIRWGTLRELEGHKVTRVGMFDKESNIIAYAQIVFHKLPKFYPSKNKFIGEVWRGPVFSETITDQEFKEFIEFIKNLGQENNCVFIKFEPKILKSTKFEEWFRHYTKSGEGTFIPCTSVLDLQKNEDELLDSFDRYTRKNINKAIRKGVEIKIITEPQAQKEAVKKVYELLKTTSARAGFRIRSSKFYENLIDIQDENIKVIIFEAKAGNGIAASYLAMTMDDVIYTPYSGSSREFSEFKANDLINWELIKYAKSIGLKKYDQWGVLPEDAPGDDPMWGVTKFKLGFNGKRENYIGAFDLVVAPNDYKLFNFAWSIRKLYKHIRKH